MLSERCAPPRRYRAWSGFGGNYSTTFQKRIKVTFAGAMIWSIGSLFLLMLLGYYSEEETREGGE